MTPETIRALRQALEMTQEALGRRVGVTANAVARWESGDRVPGLYYQERLRRLQRQVAGAQAKAALEKEEE